MLTHTILILLGALLVLAGIVGGGLSLKEIKIPALNTTTRLLACVLGMAFIIGGIMIERNDRQTGQNPGDDPAGVEIPKKDEPDPGPSTKGQNGGSSSQPPKTDPDPPKVTPTPKPVIPATTYLDNTNLLWGDIGPMPGADPAACAKACRENPNCQAWTFVKHGALPQIERPFLVSFCALKNSKSLEAVSDTCCISGFRQ